MQRGSLISWLGRCAVVMVALLVVALPVDAQRRKRTASKAPAKTTRNVEAVRKDKNVTQQRISETATKLKTNEKELNRQLNKLNSLNADIESNKAAVHSLRATVDSLGSQINVTADSITVLEKELVDMRRAYVDALKKMQPYSGAMSTYSFIFSSDNFKEAYRRIRYLRQFSAWRERKTANIESAIERVAERRNHLTSLRHSQDVAYRKAEEAQKLLARQQNESKQMVTSLRKEDATLRKSLAEYKRKAAALDKELDRMIAAEQERIAREEAAKKKSAKAQGGKKGSASDVGNARSAKDVASANAKVQTAAETAAADLTGSFASNKGRLLFPVSGKYKIVRRFGRQPHPTLPHVETDNSGIDIEVSKGAQARAVFAGKVSAIFKQDGFNTIVMIRHGKYITIYAGLASVNVRQGESVKAGQSLGSIFSDAEDSNRTILHFEIRQERQKLNPTQWVR
ncbi:MAG: peptidoglycan DD-metalloendopeptidase family protein [Duncaniella sp.]|nr:peptidoglycan DD-metalloendopeptidase family protein [Duncaniella sp.]MDE7146630.1 peptidoglycan DD-metalloendopeptidase family protein [Duncaniella sp.]